MQIMSQLLELQISDQHRPVCQNQREEMLHCHVDHLRWRSSLLDLQVFQHSLIKVITKYLLWLHHVNVDDLNLC
jgi:hypothetical protein